MARSGFARPRKPEGPQLRLWMSHRHGVLLRSFPACWETTDPSSCSRASGTRVGRYGVNAMPALDCRVERRIADLKVCSYVFSPATPTDVSPPPRGPL